MSISFTCPGCQTAYTVDDTNAGMVTDCPECGIEVTIPSKTTKTAPRSAAVDRRKTTKTSPRSAAVDRRKTTKSASRSAAPGRPQTTAVNRPESVVITDIKMPFGSMIVFMVKWALAAIPALILLFIIYSILFGIFGAMLGGLVASM